MTPNAEGRIEGKLDQVLERLAALDVRVESIVDHEARIRVLESTSGKSGRFTWGDVAKTVVAVAAVGSALGTLYLAVHG